MEYSAPRKDRSWELVEANLSDMQKRHCEVAVVPFGATEPHNLHLPYGTDIFEATIIGRKACAAATELGAKVLLLPTMPFGTETNLQKFPFAINLNPSTLTIIIEEIVQSLVHSGVRKIVLLNSHGGNDFKPVLRELFGKFPAHLFLCNWYQMVADACREIFDRPDDHAGEMETSLALAYFDHLVAKNPDGSLAADSGEKKTCQFREVEAGWIAISRPWHLLTTNSGAGNPHAATAQKGQQLMDVVVSRLANFFSELSAAALTDSFPYDNHSAEPNALRSPGFGNPKKSS